MTASWLEISHVLFLCETSHFFMVQLFLRIRKITGFRRIKMLKILLLKLGFRSLSDIVELDDMYQIRPK